MMKTTGKAVLVGLALVAVLAVLPPRCALNDAHGAEPPAGTAPAELEPITVTAPYLYPSDRQIARLRRHLPDFADGLVRQPEFIEQLSDFFAARADPNTLSAREIDWLTGH